MSGFKLISASGKYIQQSNNCKLFRYDEKRQDYFKVSDGEMLIDTKGYWYKGEYESAFQSPSNNVILTHLEYLVNSSFTHLLSNKPSTSIQSCADLIINTNDSVVKYFKEMNDGMLYLFRHLTDVSHQRRTIKNIIKIGNKTFLHISTMYIYNNQSIPPSLASDHIVELNKNLDVLWSFEVSKINIFEKINESTIFIVYSNRPGSNGVYDDAQYCILNANGLSPSSLLNDMRLETAGPSPQNLSYLEFISYHDNIIYCRLLTSIWEVIITDISKVSIQKWSKGDWDYRYLKNIVRNNEGTYYALEYVGNMNTEDVVVNILMWEDTNGDDWELMYPNLQDKIEYDLTHSNLVWNQFTNSLWIYGASKEDSKLAIFEIIPTDENRIYETLLTYTDTPKQNMKILPFSDGIAVNYVSQNVNIISRIWSKKHLSKVDIFIEISNEKGLSYKESSICVLGYNIFVMGNVEDNTDASQNYPFLIQYSR